MKKKTKIVFICLVISQIIILITLLFWIYRKQHQVVFDTRGIQMTADQEDAKDFIKLHSNDKLVNAATSSAKYFFEPTPNEKYSSSRNNISISYNLNTAYFNNSKDYTVSKPKNTYRIIMIGDSITFGLFVKTQENYSELLEKMLNQTCSLNHFEVINLGVPGYDLQYSAERLRISGLKYSPDQVIWEMNGGDFREVNEYIIPNIINAGSESAKAKAELVYQKDWPMDRLLAYQAIILNNFLKIYKGKIDYFSLYPFDSQITDMLDKTILKTDKKSLWIVEPNLVSAKGTFPDGHPNVAGHKLIAQFLMKQLLSDSTFPCR